MKTALHVFLPSPTSSRYQISFAVFICFVGFTPGEGSTEEERGEGSSHGFAVVTVFCVLVCIT